MIIALTMIRMKHHIVLVDLSWKKDPMHWSCDRGEWSHDHLIDTSFFHCGFFMEEGSHACRTLVT